jgi:hypothetical protein
MLYICLNPNTSIQLIFDPAHGLHLYVPVFLCCFERGGYVVVVERGGRSSAFQLRYERKFIYLYVP